MLRTNCFKDGVDNDTAMEDLSTTIRDIQGDQFDTLYQFTDSSLRTRNDSVDSGVCGLNTPPGPSTTSSPEPPEPELISVPGWGQGQHFLPTCFNEDGLRTLSNQEAALFSTGDPPRKRKA